MDIIARIEKLLEERKWSRYRLAVEANLPHPTITNIFCRGTIPSVATLEKICKAFDITLSEFFLEDGETCAILNDEQKRLLTYWVSLSPNQQQSVTELLERMNKTESSEPEKPGE